MGSESKSSLWWWYLILSTSLSLTSRCLEAGERDDQGPDEPCSDATEADHLIDVVPSVEAFEDQERLVPVELLTDNKYRFYSNLLDRLFWVAKSSL